ncbi:MAG: hypothetical protein A2W91_13820 [Bacteroidetes bacterium GWF2_38_335]|nr:MAG: hypothetical protein A2W91_13820 [Bacteroidetes bacterium GWF2_38_335]OFY77794.1 MAG: hypothetical protein A2281_15510 [Bacteroidetes bacterium RIFOXYA12_FULL_38_20]HBS87401.1 hypothetical protein [Bacteroidales bacterium]
MKQENSTYNIIIESGRKIFGKFGYRKTTLDNISEDANLSKTAIYYYFKNKEEIFTAVVTEEAEILKKNILQSVANFSDPKGMLRAYISSRMNTLKSVSLYYEVFKNELLDHLSFIDQIREKYHKEEIMLVSRILSEGNEAGAFNVSNIELTAETIVTILKGSEIPLFLNSNPDDLDNKLNNLIHLIIHGISKPI